MPTNLQIEMSFRTGLYKALQTAVVCDKEWETKEQIAAGTEFTVYHITYDDTRWMWGIITPDDKPEQARYVLLWDLDTIFCELIQSD